MANTRRDGGQSFVDRMGRLAYAMETAEREGRITSAMLAAAGGVSAEQARLDLAQLVRAGRLLAVGYKRARFYVPPGTRRLEARVLAALDRLDRSHWPAVAEYIAALQNAAERDGTG